MHWADFSTHWKDVERICQILLSNVGFLMSFRQAEKVSHYRGISYYNYRNQKLGIVKTFSILKKFSLQSNHRHHF